MNFKTIPLTKGFVTIVDESDFDWLNQWKWHFSSGYAKRTANHIVINTKKKHESIKLHRFIMNTPKGMLTDHINGDTLDNRRSNLRIVTTSQNCMNSSKNIKKTSVYKGVSFFKRDANWMATICKNKKKIYLGSFDTEIEAALAYNEGAKKYHGNFSRLNEIVL